MENVEALIGEVAKMKYRIDVLNQELSNPEATKETIAPHADSLSNRYIEFALVLRRDLEIDIFPALRNIIN